MGGVALLASKSFARAVPAAAGGILLMPQGDGSLPLLNRSYSEEFLGCFFSSAGSRSTGCGRLDGGLVPWHALRVVGLATVA